VIEQLKAIGVTLVISIVGTVVLASIVKALIGLRPDAEAEEVGLDYSDHGESGYHQDEGGHVPASAMAAHGATAGATRVATGI
jgi:ammonia channel protein AmtB